MRWVFVLMLLVSVTVGSAEAANYLDLSLHQYHRFEPVERFQKYMTVSIYTDRPAYRVGLDYNLFEAIDGPVSDHTLNPFTIHSSWIVLGGKTFEANMLLLYDAYDEVDSYLDTLIEARLHLPMALAGWTVDWVPMIRARSDQQWTLYPWIAAVASHRLGKSMLEVGINAQDTRDHYLLALADTAATIRLETPLWNGHTGTLEYGKLLGKDGPDSHWWAWRLELAHIAEF